MGVRAIAVQAAVTAALAVPTGMAAAPPGDYPVAQTFADAGVSAPCKVDPRDLAAIQSIESPSAIVDVDGHVTNPDGTPVRGDGGHSYGAFQFNDQAGTWAKYGNGGDPDNLHDAAFATARMLCANGYDRDRFAAIARHNGSGPAAQAYATKATMVADAMANLPAGRASDGTPAADADCAPQRGRSFAVFANRIWCGLVVGPWLRIGERSSDKAAWQRLDKMVFGDQAAAPGTPSGPLSTVNGITCPALQGVQVGDGWGAARTGHTHQGIDIFADFGSPLVAPFSGSVVDAQTDEAAGGLGGRSIVLRADAGPLAGTEVYLAHLERIDVAPGARVRQGEQIGTVGNSGNARGGDAHVHAQYYPPGQSNPAPAGAALGTPCGTNPDNL